mgnify:FL=1
MPEAKLNGPLRVLAYLLTVNTEVTLLRISQEAKMNYKTVRNAVELLKKVRFIEERYDPGPPIKRLVKLTERGRRAAEAARVILELAGEL